MAEWRQELSQRCAAAGLDPATADALQRELEEHLQDRYDDLVAGGATPAEATRVVRGEMPPPAAIRQLAKSRPVYQPPPAPTDDSGRATGWLRHVRGDLHYARRMFLKDVTFTTATLATLMLCLAANIAVFAIVNAVLFNAVSTPDGHRLVLLGNAYPGAGASAGAGGNASVPDYFDRLEAVPGLAGQALFDAHGVSVGDRDAERIRAMSTTPSLFPMLGVQAALGRTFTDDENEPGRDNKVVLSDGLWRRRFGAAPDLVGQKVTVGGIPHDVVGIMPAGFQFFDNEVELWMPAGFTAEERADQSRHNNSWSHVGRLAEGTSQDEVQAQVDRLNAANLERFPALKQVLLDAGFRTEVTPLADALVGNLKRPLYLLWGGVACVLLIGVVNLAALALARASARRGEIATRMALGAELGRIRAQLVTEHMALAAVGGLLGIGLARGLLAGLPAIGVALAPAGREVAFEARVWCYGLALTAVVGLALGTIAVRAAGTTTSPAGALRTEGRGRTSSRATRRWRQVLVAGQVALACTLLVGAGVLLASFERLLAVETGFRPSVVTGAIALTRQAYPSDDARLAFIARLLEDVRSRPGISAAGVTTNIPFGGDSSDSVVWPEDATVTPGKGLVSPDRITVSAGYFEAMGAPLVAGRTFDGSERSGSEPVVVVDEQLARRFWPGRDAVGRYLVQPLSPDAIGAPTADNVKRWRVIGVVANMKQRALVTPAGTVGTYYFPSGQDVPSGFVVAVRAESSAGHTLSELRRVVAAIDPRLPLYNTKTMQERVDDSLTARRSTMSLAVVFSALALVLSAIGLYGVLASLVAQRTREIGIRMALGGSRRAIAKLVFSESAAVVGAGLVAGIAGAWWLGRALASEVFEVSTLDPTALGTAVVLLVAAAAAATAGPVRRALRVDPVVTLAAE